MSSIYLINIGSNVKDRSKARSPIFDDGTFVFVSFPTDSPHGPPGYSDNALAFVRPNIDRFATHADPDWPNLTYGDYCSNPRAATLKYVKPGDILLFWGLLWQNTAGNWNGFTDVRGWYLFGAIHVSEIVVGDASIADVSEPNRGRASKNVHFSESMHLPTGHRVFIGDNRYSKLFQRAVDLGVADDNGLMYKAFTSANGDLLKINGTPSWKSSLRSCRRMWDLACQTDRARAEIVASAIQKHTDYDLFCGGVG